MKDTTLFNEKKKVSYITKSLVSSALDIHCPKPVTRKNRLGLDVLCPCGDCEECLRAKRNQLVSRLKVQINDVSNLYTGFATYTYGDLQVYDAKNHSWTIDKKGVTLPTISKSDIHNCKYDYDDLGFYKPVRVNVHDKNDELKRRDLYGIVYPRDLQLCLKKIRVRFDEEVGHKYNISVKFQSLAHYGTTPGRTFAPHFHVIYFLVCEDKTALSLIQGQPILLQNIVDIFKKIALTSWVYCSRWYDSHKQRYVGKDIEDVRNGNISCYVSRYISRSTLRKRLSIASLFPVRKYGSKNLGYQFLNDKKELSRFYQAVILTKQGKSPFLVTYNENGFTKQYSSYVRFRFLLKYFGVTSLQFQNFCRMQNDCICRNAFYVDDAQKTSLSNFLDVNTCYYTTAQVVPHRKNSRYINRFSKREKDKQTLEYSTGKSVSYDFFGYMLISPLSDDVFQRCSKMYDFINLSSSIGYKQMLEKSDISDLQDLKNDDVVLSLESSKYSGLSVGISHSFAYTILGHFNECQKRCDEIIENNEKLENLHAIKNHYI